MIERLRVRIPAGATREFSTPDLTLCADSYSVSVPPPCYDSGTQKIPVILPKVQVAGYTLEPTKSEWADYAAVQAQCWNLFVNGLTRSLLGIIRPQSSQLSEPLWSDPGIKSGISVRKLMSTSKQLQQKAQAGNKWPYILQNPRKRGKSHHHHHHHQLAGFKRPVTRGGRIKTNG